MGCETACVRDGLRIDVRTEYFVSSAKKMDKVAAGATARVEYSHTRCYAAAKQLIEKIDVDLAKLFAEICHD